MNRQSARNQIYILFAPAERQGHKYIGESSETRHSALKIFEIFCSLKFKSSNLKNKMKI